MSVHAKVAGTLLLVGGVQFIISLVIAEAVYPGYSVSANFISDLGVWGEPSAAIFNPSTIILGSLMVAGAYFIKKHYNLGKIAYLFGLAAVGALGVGIFPENTFLVGRIPVIHFIAAALAFIVGAFAAIASYRYTKGPFRVMSVVLGVAALTAGSLYIAGHIYGYLGIGVGGMERMIAYPTLLWIVSFGGYLLGDANTK
jgi:hypothetical membrane protein